MNMEEIKNQLSEETNFSNYINLLGKFAGNYTIIITSSDTPCGSKNFTPQVAINLMNVGFAIPLHDKWRCSYAAISDKGKLVFEGISQTNLIQHECSIEETNILVRSLGYSTTDGARGSRIIIDGTDYTLEGRGLTFVIFDRETKTLVDSANFDTYADDIIRSDKKIMTEKFIQEHPGITFIFPQYPHFPEKNLSLNEENLIKNRIDFNLIKEKADSLKTVLNEYINDSDGIREVLNTPSSYIGTDGARHLNDYSGKHLNIINGHRITMNQPQNPMRTIYIVGGCGMFGIGARDCGTLASQLQIILNAKAPEQGFIVENYGFFLDGLDNEQEITNILKSLPLKNGDIVIGYGGIKTALLPSESYANDCGEVFFDCTAHVTESGHKLVAENVFKVLDNNNFFAEKVKQGNVKEIKFDNLERTNYGLTLEQQKKLEEYKLMLSTFYNEQFENFEKQPVIGAIVMNCNPFTLGHRYLIEECAKKVDFLVVFVVKEDKSFFPFEDRINLVDEGTSDLKNVGVVESGNFIISTLTFSEYFNKSELQNRAVDTSKDVTLFAREIAPAMHISIRFAGSEPFDSVTEQYNRTLAKTLPAYGINFEEIPRVEVNGKAVSASRVRDLLAKKDWKSIKNLVPKTTFDYLQENYK